MSEWPKKGEVLVRLKDYTATQERIAELEAQVEQYKEIAKWDWVQDQERRMKELKKILDEAEEESADLRELLTIVIKERDELAEGLSACNKNYLTAREGSTKYDRIMQVWYMIQRGDSTADVEDLFDLLREFDDE